MKLLKKHICNKEVSNVLLTLCKDIISTCNSHYCLKSFISVLNTFPKSIPEYESVCENIMFSLSLLVSKEANNEIFVFSGKFNSGLNFLSAKNLPQDGFCFCGCIRLERRNQAEPNPTEHMTIFELAASRTEQLELFIKKGHLNYRVIGRSEPRCEAELKAKEW